MNSKKNITLTLMGIASVICLYVGDLSAWERRPLDLNHCRQDGLSDDRCRKQWAEDNQHDFETYLGSDAYKIYENFTPDQKLSAMDMADRNAMDPDVAVSKVGSGMRP